MSLHHKYGQVQTQMTASNSGGGQVVSVLAFNTDDLSSNPDEVYLQFFCRDFC